MCFNLKSFVQKCVIAFFKAELFLLFSVNKIVYSFLYFFWKVIIYIGLSVTDIIVLLIKLLTKLISKHPVKKYVDFFGKTTSCDWQENCRKKLVDTILVNSCWTHFLHLQLKTSRQNLTPCN